MVLFEQQALGLGDFFSPPIPERDVDSDPKALVPSIQFFFAKPDQFEIREELPFDKTDVLLSLFVPFFLFLDERV